MIIVACKKKEKKKEKQWKSLFSRCEETMSPHLAMALEIVIRLATVSISYLILHQVFSD